MSDWDLARDRARDEARLEAIARSEERATTGKEALFAVGSRIAFFNGHGKEIAYFFGAVRATGPKGHRIAWDDGLEDERWYPAAKLLDEREVRGDRRSCNHAQTRLVEGDDRQWHSVCNRCNEVLT